MLKDGNNGGVDLDRHGGHYNYGGKKNKFQYQDTRTNVLLELSKSVTFEEDDFQYEGGGDKNV